MTASARLRGLARWLGATLGPLALASCAPTVTGGYAAECARTPVDGWRVDGPVDYSKELAQGTLGLHTRHLDSSSEPATLIELQALLSPTPHTGRYPVLLFDPRTAWLDVQGKIVPAEPTLRENPFMQAAWKSGGVVPTPADMDKATPVVLTFATRIAPGTGFVLHLGQFVVAGSPVAIPDIRYCPVPRATTWAPFHG